MRYGDLAADSIGADDDRPALVLLHGLTFNRRHWAVALADPAIAGSNRRVVNFDLPGHGESPRRDSYKLADLADVLHAAITEAHLDSPVVAGHSAGGVLATSYAARYPVRGVVNIDQPLRPGGFGEFLRRSEPVLKSDDFLKVWDMLLDGMHLDELPPSARELVRTVSTPRKDLFLGYWKELLDAPEQARGQLPRPGCHPCRQHPVPLHCRQRRRPRVPGLARSRPPRCPDHRTARQRSFPAPGPPGRSRESPRPLRRARAKTNPVRALPTSR